MKLIELKIKDKPYEIASKNIYFTIVNEKGYMTHGLTGCRGYINDIIGAWLRDNSHACCFENDYLDFFVGSEKGLLSEFIPKLESLINNICKSIGFKNIEFFKVTNILSEKDEYFILRIDKNWVIAPFMISFLLIVVRNLAFNYNGEDLIQFFEGLKEQKYRVQYDNLEFKNSWIERDIDSLNKSHENIINFIKYGPVPFMSLNAKNNFNNGGTHDYGMTEFSVKGNERKFVFSAREASVRRSIIRDNIKVLA